MSWRNDIKERTRAIGRTGRDIGRRAAVDLGAFDVWPRWVRETIASLFILALVLGAAKAPSGLAGSVVTAARYTTTADVAYEDVLTFIGGVPDRLRSLAAFDLRNFWSRAATAEDSTLAWPVEGQITGQYGWRNDPVTAVMAYHKGLDIAGEIGTPVAATLAGTVTAVRVSAEYGLLVEIRHAGGLTSLYGHLESAQVSVEDKVKKGDIIGTLGDSGNATGPHLHFEVRKDGIEVDPVTLLPPLVKGP